MKLYQNRLVYSPTDDILSTPDKLSLKYEDIFFPTSDATSLNGWYIAHKNAKGTILFMHGNAWNISYYTDALNDFYLLGFNVFIFDYRGYGKSEGSPSENGTYEDAKSAYDFLVNQKDIKPKDIILVGRSLGGAIASQLASHISPKALILESTFSDIKELASYRYPFIPKFIVDFNYVTAQHLNKINTPTLIVHSKDDKTVPFTHGVDIFKKAKEPKMFLELKGTHNRCYEQDKEKYINGVKKFLKDT
jgi:fermentation-respiration switch protein FrsA (DUF1100 family)